jgi:hypothetical protein
MIRIALALMVPLLLGGCFSYSEPAPPSHTTVVVPPGSAVTTTCSDGGPPPCN